MGTEELISDYTFLASLRISRTARNEGYKVMLSGMGADEIFAGYPRYLQVKYHRLLNLLSKFTRWLGPLKMVPNSVKKRIERFHAFFDEDDFILAYTRLLGYFSRRELDSLLTFDHSSQRYTSRLKSLVGERFDTLTPLKKAMLLDFYGFLSHNLSVTDKSSMAASIEVRVPFIQKEIYDAAIEDSDSHLIHRFQSKFILKSLLRKRLPRKYASSEKFVGALRRRQIAKCMI